MVRKTRLSDMRNEIKFALMTAGVRNLVRWLVLAGGTCASWFACSAAEQDFVAARKRMIERQIVARGITNQRVLKVMGTVPRHELVPASYRNRAYVDEPVPIGYAQTISQPYVVALMTEQLDPKPTDRVLEIGTGSGYQAAILGQLAAEVYSIEIVPELARSAANTLRELGYTNITVRQGDGYKGWPERAPFDGIMVTAAPPELPQALVAQLARGGRLVAPIGSTWNQELIVIEKKTDGTITRRSMGAVSFVPMKPGGR